MEPLRSETCWTTFKYFIILIVSTYYILCISWITKCLIIIDARCNHEDYFHSVYRFRQCDVYLLISMVIPRSVLNGWQHQMYCWKADVEYRQNGYSIKMATLSVSLL